MRRRCITTVTGLKTLRRAEALTHGFLPARAQGSPHGQRTADCSDEVASSDVRMMRVYPGCGREAIYPGVVWPPWYQGSIYQGVPLIHHLGYTTRVYFSYTT